MQPFRMLPAKPSRVEPAESLHFWYPGRFGVEFAPDRFRQLLHGISPDLEATYHPLRERWTVWCRQPRVTHYLCPGWLLLFEVENSQGERLPLDARTLAAIYEVSARKWGNGVVYWDRIEAEAKRDNELLARSNDCRARDIAGERYDYAQIKNIGSGDKFCRYHAGD